MILWGSGREGRMETLEGKKIGRRGIFLVIKAKQKKRGPGEGLRF